MRRTALAHPPPALAAALPRPPMQRANHAAGAGGGHAVSSGGQGAADGARRRARRHLLPHLRQQPFGEGRPSFPPPPGRLPSASCLRPVLSGLAVLDQGKGRNGCGALRPPACTTRCHAHPAHPAPLEQGVLFFSVTTFLVSSFPDAGLLVESLPVWYKHRAARCAAARRRHHACCRSQPARQQ